jgi:hypothetical protein
MFLLCTILASCSERTRTYQAWVDVDGKGPPGFSDLASPGPDTDKVLIYRFGKNDTLCFDSFSSKELHDRLLSKNRTLVAVEYDASTYLLSGKVYGYNVRAIDGIVLAKLRSGEPVGGGGGVGSRGPGTVSGDDCW